MLPVSGLHGLFVAFMEETAKIDFSDLQQRFKRVTQPPAGRLLARRWGGSAAPEHFNGEGSRGPTARGTQKERHTYSVSFFLVEQKRPYTNKRQTNPYGSSGALLVEAGRVELPSENPSMGTSPGADGYCGSPALPVPLSPGKPSRPGVG